MRPLLLRRIIPEDQKSVRDFFRDAKNLAPEDIEKFIDNIEKHAARLGGSVNIEKTESKDTAGIELWLEQMKAAEETRRIFAIRRHANVVKLGNGRKLLSAAGPYYITRDINIQPYAVHVTPAIMNMDAESLIQILRTIRMIKVGKDLEKVREARYDLYAACSGTKVGFVDLFSGERMEILGH
ncbi:MAG: hypothetical protein AB1324_01425 [Candidatus Micrarchaeota archaeon]